MLVTTSVATSFQGQEAPKAKACGKRLVEMIDDYNCETILITSENALMWFCWNWLVLPCVGFEWEWYKVNMWTAYDLFKYRNEREATVIGVSRDPVSKLWREG